MTSFPATAGGRATRAIYGRDSFLGKADRNVASGCSVTCVSRYCLFFYIKNVYFYVLIYSLKKKENKKFHGVM